MSKVKALRVITKDGRVGAIWTDAIELKPEVTYIVSIDRKREQIKGKVLVVTPLDETLKANAIKSALKRLQK